MVSPIRITAAQLNPIVGDIKGNAARMEQVWREYDATSDLILFPELFLCGYPPEDLVLNSSFVHLCRSEVENLIALSKGKSSAALIPAPWIEDQKLYNAALLIEDGHMRSVIKKSILPNDYVFDEKRTFTPNTAPMVSEYKGHKLGIMICEDIWHAQVASTLKNQGAEVLIAINGSPYHKQQSLWRKEVLHKRIDETGLDVIYLNMVGGQDELVFDGASMIINKDQVITYQAPAFEEHIFTLSYPLSALSETQPIYDTQDMAHLYKAACIGLRDYVQKNKFTNVLIGLSGGIDSALCAAMAVDALGADKVRCIMLPSEFTTGHSLEDAKSCADNLGVSYQVISIKEIMHAYEDQLTNLSGLAHENTQSRIRGSILMAQSNATGAMLLTTGNKSEMAVGYCTLYGDMNGGYNPLKDLYKTEVYSLCRWLNEDKVRIPERIITKAPSAELRADQTDQDSLPDYDLLDAILTLLIEYDYADWNNPPAEIADIVAACKAHPDEVAHIARLLKITEYKRYQAPPGARLTYRGFGRDRRYPMTNGFINKIENH